MATVHLLSGKNFSVEIPEDETTMREFLIKIAPLFISVKSNGDIKEVIWGNDFIWSLRKIQPAGSNLSGYINTFENRHKLVRDLIKPEDRLYASLWVLGSPANSLIFKNNLLSSDYSYETQCGICLEEFNPKAVYDCILPCKHKFHYRCLAQLVNFSCPMCNASIPEDLIHIIRKYVCDEKLELISM